MRKVAVFSDWQVANCGTKHLQPGPELPLARCIDQTMRDVRKVSIATVIPVVTGFTGIPGNVKAGCKINVDKLGHMKDAQRE